MKCRRSLELDLAAFLVDPRAAAFEDFRRHYPFCPDCAAEVAAWTAVQESLARHPEPELLLRFSDDDPSLEPPARAEVARHLAGCASCRDELRALDGFAADAAEPAPDTAPAAAPAATGAALQAPEPDAAARSPRRTEFGRRDAHRHGSGVASARPATAHGHRDVPARGGLRTVRRLLWHPALAYAALIVILLVPAFRSRLDEAARRDLVGPVDGSRLAATPAGAPPARRAAAPAGAEDARGAAPSSEAVRAQAAGPARAAQVEASSAAASGALEAPAPAPPPAAVGTERAAELRGAARLAERSPERAAAARHAPSIRLGGVDAAGQRALVITLPRGAVAHGVVEVHVRAASGRRELREQLQLAPDATEVALELPAGWLGEPRYLVEVYADGALLARGSVAPG